MRSGIMLAIVITLLFALGDASALEYRDEPHITAYIAQNNHIDLGEEATLMVVMQNDARLWKLVYSTPEEFRLLSQNPEYMKMLTTAMNVSVKFESDELEIKTPEMFFAALPAFQPFQLPVVVDAAGVEAGEYEINMSVRYEVVDDISFSSEYSVVPFPSKDVYYYNLTSNPFYPVSRERVLTNKTVYYLDYIKIEYKTREQTIKLRVVVEKADVILNVTAVESDLIAGGKGKITVTIRNEGKKDAENLFAVLSVPSGFVPQGIQQFDAESINKALSSILSQNPQLSMLGIQDIQVTIPSELQTILSQSSVYIGSLKANETINVTFAVDVSIDEGGFYPFQISGIYTADGEVKQTPPASFGVRVKDKPAIRVEKVESNVFAGSKGDVIVKLVSDSGLKSVKGKIETDPPLNVIAGQFYAGDGESFEMRFKVKAGDDAENVVYPAKLTVTYDLSGKEASETFDIGIRVGEKIRFEIDGIGEIPAGDERVISVKIRNTGGYEVRDATARITVVDPFSTTDDSSFIGTLKPGEEKEISFRMKADSDATPKSYALNLEVKYRDINGEWVISDPVKLPVRITESQKTIPGFELLAGVIAIIAGLLWLRR